MRQSVLFHIAFFAWAVLNKSTFLILTILKITLKVFAPNVATAIIAAGCGDYDGDHDVDGGDDYDGDDGDDHDDDRDAKGGRYICGTDSVLFFTSPC